MSHTTESIAATSRPKRSRFRVVLVIGIFVVTLSILLFNWLTRPRLVLAENLLSLRLVYIDGGDGRLWQSRLDGSEPQPLDPALTSQLPESARLVPVPASEDPNRARDALLTFDRSRLSGDWVLWLVEGASVRRVAVDGVTDGGIVNLNDIFNDSRRVGLLMSDSATLYLEFGKTPMYMSSLPPWRWGGDSFRPGLNDMTPIPSTGLRVFFGTVNSKINYGIRVSVDQAVAQTVNGEIWFMDGKTESSYRVARGYGVGVIRMGP